MKLSIPAEAPTPLKWIHNRPKSELQHESMAALVGIALGVAFMLCFATGVLSHLIQYPTSWFSWPARPAGFYRISQGVHTITGFLSIPLLLAKLWIVYPKLFEWPPFKSLSGLLERLSLLPLVGGGLFLGMSGTANVARWYPWGFFFPAAHYWVAWITIGALFIHLGAKWTIVRRTVRPGAANASAEPPTPDTPADVAPSLAARRRFLGGVTATTAAVFFAVAGNTISPLSKLAALAQRRPGSGPQGVPVNKSARGAGVTETAIDPDYTLSIAGNVETELTFTLAELQAMDQHNATLPIACVEGWSTTADWTGVQFRTLLELAGAPTDSTVDVESLQEGGLYRKSTVNPNHAQDRDTLLALRLNGEPLHIDHGFPVRLIGPNRPGVQQTKWVTRLVVQ